MIFEIYREADAFHRSQEFISTIEIRETLTPKRIFDALVSLGCVLDAVDDLSSICITKEGVNTYVETELGVFAFFPRRANNVVGIYTYPEFHARLDRSPNNPDKVSNDAFMASRARLKSALSPSDTHTKELIKRMCESVEAIKAGKKKITL